MKNSTLLVAIAFTFAQAIGLAIGCSTAQAAEYHPAPGTAPGTAPGNPPSAARAKAVKAGRPGGCVVTHKISADGTIHRISRCVYN